MPDALSDYMHDFTDAEARDLMAALGKAARESIKPRWWTPKTPEELAAADQRVKACVAQMIAERRS